MDSNTLLWQYVHDRSDAAFEQIVRQHAGLVYSSAMRRTQTSTLAEDVTQQVFCDLARKAKDLPGDVILSGWLYRHTGFTAAKLMRGEARRMRREAKAAEMMMDTTNETDGDAAWSRLAPHLEAALDSLSAKDRQVILLRYFEEQSLRRVGEMLGISEEASRKRVQRALAKMRQSLCRRGIQTTATILAVTLTGRAVQAAPQGLVEQVLDRTAAMADAPVAMTSAAITSAKWALLGAFVTGFTVPVAWPNGTAIEHRLFNSAPVSAAADGSVVQRVTQGVQRPTLDEVLSAEGIEQWRLLVAFLPEASVGDLEEIAHSWGPYDWSLVASAKWKLLLGRWLQLDPDSALQLVDRLDLHGRNNLRAVAYAAWAEADYPTAVGVAETIPEAAQAMIAIIAQRDPSKARELFERYPGMRGIGEVVLKEMAKDRPQEAFARAMALPASSRSRALAAVVQVLAKADPKAALQQALEIPYTYDRDRAVHVLVSDMVAMDTDQAADVWQQLPHGINRRDLLHTLARAQAERDATASIAWANSLADVQERRIALSITLRQQVERGQADLLTLLDEHGWDLVEPNRMDTVGNGGIEGGDLGNDARKVILQLAESDPERAFALFDRFPSGSPLADIVGDLVSHHTDFQKAETWLPYLNDENRRTKLQEDLYKRWLTRDPVTGRERLEAADIPDDTKASLLQQAVSNQR